MCGLFLKLDHQSVGVSLLKMASAIFDGTSLVNMFVKDCWVNGLRRLIIRGEEEEFFEIRTEWSDRNILYLHRSSSDLGRLLKRLLECFPEDRQDLLKSPLIEGIYTRIIYYVLFYSTNHYYLSAVFRLLDLFNIFVYFYLLHFKEKNGFAYHNISAKLFASSATEKRNKLNSITHYSSLHLKICSYYLKELFKPDENDFYFCNVVRFIRSKTYLILNQFI